MHQNASGKEQRDFIRFPCNILVHFDGSNQSGVGVLTDLSRGGARLTCRLSGKLIGLIRISAFNTNPNAKMNSTLGQTAWQRTDDESGRSQVGLAFELDKHWLEQALTSDASAPAWDCPDQRLDLVLGY